MSYSLYTWLQEDPQHRDGLLQQCDIPSVQAEYRRLRQHILDADLNDAVLWWSDNIQRKFIATGVKLPVTREFLTSKFLLLLYSLHLQGVLMEDFLAHLMYNAYTVEKAARLQHWTIPKFVAWQTSQKNSECLMYLDSYFGVQSMTHDTHSMLEVILEYCTEQFVMRFVQTHASCEVSDVYLLVSDCYKPAADKKFTSMNSIQRAHDYRAADITAELMTAKENKRFVYSQRLQDIAAQYDINLPADVAAFVTRGAVHHNCVATYADKQVNTVNRRHVIFTKVSCRLVVFTKEATLELECELGMGIIISTRVVQYKGVYNKTLETPDNVLRFRASLVREPVSILEVQYDYS